MSKNPLDLDELDRLEKTATPGPWSSYTASCCPDMGGIAYKNQHVCKSSIGVYGHPMEFHDAEFVVAVRNALPELITELRALRDELAELEYSVFTAHGKLSRLAALIMAKGCNCGCDHHHEEHDDDCARCLACLINAVLCE